jgi:hypothetical protein
MTEPRDEWEAGFLAEFKRLAAIGVKLRKVMGTRKLTRCKAHCPKPGCGGMLWATLHPSRRNPCGNALHFQCDGPCKAVYME